jgi:hypothetical protein
LSLQIGTQFIVVFGIHLREVRPVMTGENQNGPNTNEEPKQPQLPAPPEREKNWGPNLAVDVVLGKNRLSSLSPHVKSELRHYPAIWKLIPVSIILGTIVILCAGYVSGRWHKGRSASKELEGFLNASNQLSGKLEQQKEDYRRLEKQGEKERQDANNQITQLRIDLGDVKRERDSNKQRLEFLEANAATVYTNIANWSTNGPPTRQQISDLMGSVQTLTNNSQTELMPAFTASLNGGLLSSVSKDPTWAPLPKDRRITFLIQNVGPITAEHITLDLFTFCDGTNIIAPPPWRTQAPSSGSLMILNQPIYTNPIPHWVETAELSTASTFGFGSTPLSISTNFGPHILYCELDIHSDRSRLQRFYFVAAMPTE